MKEREKDKKTREKSKTKSNIGKDTNYDNYSKYSKLGLKVGFEIHQQLDTHKLFCDCPSKIRKDKPDIIVKRKLHAVAGELGNVDIAALHEMQKQKTFVYEAYNDTTCLVELDEEPPHEINQEALHTALQVTMLLNAKPFKAIRVMRKTVIDGSNPSGFQRTMLIARNGWLRVNGKKIKIDTICLEEEAARKISKDEKTTTYRLDRLGIPLIEIATEPLDVMPREAKQVALKIGSLLRSCKIKHGIGTIRQDVNVSIKGGVRTEIKGVQEPSLITKVIINEADRQEQAIKKGIKLKSSVRKAMPDGTTSFLRPMPGKSRMYPETDLPIITLSQSMLKQIEQTLPTTIEQKMKQLQQYINEGVAKQMLQYFDIFMKLVKKHKYSGMLIANMIKTSKHVKENINGIDEIITAYESDKLTKAAVMACLQKFEKSFEKNHNININSIINGYKKLTAKELEKQINKEIKKSIDYIKSKGLKIKPDAITGMIVGKFKMKADTKDIVKTTKGLLSKEM